MIVEIIITSIVCGTALIAYIVRLMFMSKCKKSECMTKNGVMRIERSTEEEKQNVSNLRIPL